MTCIVTGLTLALDYVGWKKGADDVTTLSDYGTNYVLLEGNLEGNSQTTTLEVIDAGVTDTDYFCVFTSNEHGETSKETSVKLDTFRKFFIVQFKIIKFLYDSQFYILI